MPVIMVLYTTEMRKGLKVSKRFHIHTVLVVVALVLSIITIAATAQESRIVRETFHSPSIKGNLFGDSPDRQVIVYLPPSYDDGNDQVYPVVYLLHGYTGDSELWVDGRYAMNGRTVGNILNSMDVWLGDGRVNEMIIVMPDANTKFDGSFYTNSIAAGNWSDYISRDLVDYIDSNYRTLPQRESRGVVGHSMGGYGGIKLGILYPEVFGCMGGIGGVYDIRRDTDSDPAGYAYASTIEDWAHLGAYKAYVNICVLFAPNPDRPPFYCDFPFVYTETDPRKVVKVDDVYNKFMEHDILEMIDNRVSTISKMRAIYIDCGTNDWPLISDARKLHQKLSDLGVEHVYKEFAGDHFCCVMTSVGNALETFSDAMAFDMLVAVETVDKLAATWGQMKNLHYEH